MRILITADPELEIPAIYYGGVERIVYALVNEYGARGHEVLLLANTNKYLPLEVSFHPWKNSSSLGSRNILNNAITLYQQSRKFRPDVIHSFSRLLFLYPIFTLTSIRVVQSYGRYISPKSTAMAKKIGSSRLQLTACAGHMLNHLANKKDWRVISNFLELHTFDFVEQPADNYLLFLGRIEDIKGTREAIELALKTERRLIIAGNVNEDQKEYYEREILPYEDHPLISLIGPVNDKQKNQLLGNAAATILPFKLKVEAFGLTIIESMACGTPVISFDIAAVPEIIDDGKTGFICDSLEEMIEAVGRINTLNRKEIRSAVEKRFTSTQIAKEYLELFESLQ